MSAADRSDARPLTFTVAQLSEAAKILGGQDRAARRARGLVCFDGKAGAIYLYSAVHPDGYEVDTDRLKTAAQLVNWIYHLRGKIWFSDQHLSDFLAVVQESCGDPRSWGKAKG